MPTLTQLKYILAVHRHGHFKKAAEACHVSQPTLSAQVQKAEDTLGFVIFAREPKPVTLTHRGQALIEAAHQVVEAHERLLQLARGQSDTLSGTLTLGIIPTLAPYVLPWFLPSFAQAHPRVQLNILERNTEGIVEDLGARHLDAAILATPLHVPSLQERVLFHDPFYLYAAPSEPLLQHDEVAPEALEPGKLWLLQDGHCVRTQTLAACGLAQGALHLRSVRFEAGSFETLRHLIDASEGYTILPETYVRLLSKERRRNQVRALGEPTPTRQISLVHPSSTYKCDLLDALEHILRERIPRPLRSTEGTVLPVFAADPASAQAQEGSPPKRTRRSLSKGIDRGGD